MFLPALVCLSVCLFVTTITKRNVDGPGRNFLGRFLGGKQAQVRFRLRSLAGCGGYCPKCYKPGIFSNVNKPISNVNKPTNHLTQLTQQRSTDAGGRKLRFRGDLYFQESTFPLVIICYKEVVTRPGQFSCRHQGMCAEVGGSLA